MSSSEREESLVGVAAKQSRHSYLLPLMIASVFQLLQISAEKKISGFF
jgi:hypothetical protein